MTNDLFRDLLEGRISMPRKRIRPGIYFLPNLKDPSAPTMKELAAGVNISHFLTIDGYSPYPWPHIAPGKGWDESEPSPPADLRARALQHKQHQNHGPKDASLRTRGRNNRYKEKP